MSAYACDRAEVSSSESAASDESEDDGNGGDTSSERNNLSSVAVGVHALADAERESSSIGSDKMHIDNEDFVVEGERDNQSNMDVEMEEQRMSQLMKQAVYDDPSCSNNVGRSLRVVRMKDIQVRQLSVCHVFSCLSCF